MPRPVIRHNLWAVPVRDRWDGTTWWTIRRRNAKRNLGVTKGEGPNPPTLAKIAKAWNNVRLVIETFVDPPSNLSIQVEFTMRLCQYNQYEMDIQLLTGEILSRKSLVLPVRISNESQELHQIVLRDPTLEDCTRLMNMIRSSGTPSARRTSTAFIAEPPVAES